MSRIIITGATSGIGRALAIEFARQGSELVLLSRNRKRGEKVAGLCESLNPETRTTFLPVDLASQESVGKGIQTMCERFDRIDILINNAGALFDRYQESPDGIELTFATNHLGPFQLNLGLIELLRNAAPGVVVNVSSIARKQADDDPDWLVHRDFYDRWRAYARSKLANALFSARLAEIYPKSELIAITVDPGIVATRFAINNGLIPWLKFILYHWQRGVLVSPNSVAKSIMGLLVDERLSNFAGGVVCQGELLDPLPSLNLHVARKLWSHSVSLLGKNLKNSESASVVSVKS